MTINFSNQDLIKIKDCIKFIENNDTESWISDLKKLDFTINREVGYTYRKMLNSLIPHFEEYFRHYEHQDINEFIIKKTSKIIGVLWPYHTLNYSHFQSMWLNYSTFTTDLMIDVYYGSLMANWKIFFLLK